MKSHILKILLASNVIFVLASSFLGPLFTVFIQQFNTDVVVISATWAIFIGSASLFMLIFYRIGDHLNKLQLLQFGFLMRAIVWTSYIFVGNIWAILALQLALGLGEACGTPAFSALFPNISTTINISLIIPNNLLPIMWSGLSRQSVGDLLYAAMASRRYLS